MKSGDKKLVALLLLLVLVAAAVLLLPSGELDSSDNVTLAECGVVEVDDNLPSFTVEMTSGEVITPEMLRGKVVLVNFWATWCPPCRQELQRVEKDIVERYAGRDFIFLPISRGEQRQTVVEFLSESGYTFAAGLDPDQSIYNLFAKEYIPRNYLVNRFGVVVEATVGYEPKEFDALLEKIDMTLNAR